MLVALLFANHDKQLAFKNLDWMEEIGVGQNHELLIVCPSGVSEQDAEKAVKIGERAFSDVKLCHLSDDCTTGWPFGPNFMFRRTVDYISHFNLYPFLLLESDAWLLYEDSLDAIEAEYEKAMKRDLVFMGYKEMEGKSGEHMNGVGVYGNINIHAPTALSAPWPQDQSQVGANKMAFDMAGAAEIVPKMHNSRLFQFQYKQEERLLKDTSLSFLNPDAKIFHTEKTGRLVDLLRARDSATIRGRIGIEDTQKVRGSMLSSVIPPAMRSTEPDPSRNTERVTCDIFIKTWAPDAMWHEKCLESIKRYCSGFRGVCVDAEEQPNGYLHQQVVKLNADRYTDANYILATDSDTLFTQPVTPESFFKDGKPKWHLTPKQEVLAADPNTDKWFSIMDRFLGEPPQHEFMRRQPFFVPRWLLEAFRAFCWRKHGMSVESYVMGQQHFSEWNCLGFYAWRYHRESFSWVDNAEPLVVKQFWSPHNQTPQQRQRLFEEAFPEINRILGLEEVEPEPPKRPHPATINPPEGWSTIAGPSARMNLAGEMLKKQEEEAAKKLKMKERMAKARAALGKRSNQKSGNI